VEEIIRRNEDRLLRFACALTGSKADAEDAVQSAFVKLVEKNPRFETEEHETAWLMTVTKNLCKSLLRSYWRRNRGDLLESYPAANAEQRELIELVAKLPVKYKAVVHLFYYEGYSAKEISAITNQNEAAVRIQLTRARRMLKQELAPEYLQGGEL